jgi:hypothetical protein
MTVSPSTSSPSSSIHRRNRDLDVVLLFFLGVFVFLEVKRFQRIETHVLDATFLGNKTFWNLTVTTTYKAKSVDRPDTVTTSTTASSGSTVKSSHGQKVTFPDTRPSIAVNWEHILSHPNCILRDDENNPLPLVFMALGRTGSSVTWATVAKILGDAEPEKAIEIVGRVHPEATEFFQSIPEQLASSWPSAYICDLQSNFTRQGLHSTGLVGFQWKPYMVEFDNPKAWSGLKDLAGRTVTGEDDTADVNASSNPNSRRPNPKKIRLIYQTRNAIDRRLSNWKHSRSDRSVAPHCSKGDEKCVENHMKHTKMVNFTTGKELLHWLQSDKENEEKVFQRLNDVGVDFIHVTYENLYMSQNADEWMRIFRFLGRGPAHGLTMDTVQESFSMMKTSNKTHKDVIENYAEVQKTLEGTEFEHLLTG